MSAPEYPPAGTAPLIDSHCHLDTDAFAADRDEVLVRARAAGLTRIVAIGAGRGEAGPWGALALAEAHPGSIAATVGLHPHDASLAARVAAGGAAGVDAAHRADSLFADLARAAAHPAVVGIGETGLDFHYDFSPREVQRDVFRRQIDLARTARKPLVIHTRSAAAETLAILREENARDVGGIIHCFSEDPAFARAALDLGFVSSWSGLVTFSKAGLIKDAARAQPLDALLVETDAPFLAPAPKRGRRNEPAYVAWTADFIAKERGIDREEFRALTTANACRVFGLAP